MSDDSKLVEAREKIVAKLLLSECHMEPSDRNRLAAEIVDALSAHPAGDVALRNAALDALSGWQYIRRRHGDLEGVGWDRVESALTSALATPAAPTILISQEWLDAKNATDPDAECDAAAPTERDPIGVQEGICTVPPEGWWCSRTPGHEGPCAARPIEESDAPLTDDENAMIDRAWERHKAAAPTDPHVHRVARRMDAKWVEREAAPTDAGALVEELEALFTFLRGEGELDGKWFGDTVPGTPPYWWRKHVRQLQPRLTALRASTGTPAEGEGV